MSADFYLDFMRNVLDDQTMTFEELKRKARILEEAIPVVERLLDKCTADSEEWNDPVIAAAKNWYNLINDFVISNEEE